MNVSLRVPAYFLNFSTLTNGRTVAKLKVFYIGETADGRIFDEKIANKLKATLAGCPVVGYFSDLKGDFIGHNSVQYIYGFVTPEAAEKAEFEEIDGQTWLVTEVMLYTDRVDNIGEVAKKIVGKPHSLEMDPRTAKYECFKENGKTKIKFIDASLIGLSVLADDQKPAFTGSEFFSVANFGLNDLREKFENFFSYLENSRGEQMEQTQFEQLANFVRLSYNEKMSLAETKLQEQLGDDSICYICEMDDSSFVAETFDFNTGKHAYYKYDYSMGGDVDFAIENAREAFRKFVTREELEKLEASVVAECDPEKKKDEDDDNADMESKKLDKDYVPGKLPSSNSTGDSTSEGSDDETVDTPTEDSTDTPAEGESGDAGDAAVTAEKQEDDKSDEDTSEDDKKDEEDKEAASAGSCDPEDKKDKSDCAVDEKENKKEEENEDEDESKEEKENCSSKDATLSDCERIELENYRRLDKINLINSFKNMLSDDILESFTNKVDEYDKAKLEAELAVEFSRISRLNKATDINTETVVEQARNPFSMNKPEGKLSYAELVAKQLAKTRK